MAGLITTDLLDMRRGAAPSNPSSGVDRMYWKNDGYPYTRDSAGTERAFLLSTVPEADKTLLDNTTDAWAIVQGEDVYMSFKTTNGSEAVVVGADPSTVTTARLLLRGGLGGLAMTSTNGMTLDAVGALELNSSTSSINIGTDAIGQPINFGTSGARELNYGSILADHVSIGASYSYAVAEDVEDAYILSSGAGEYLNLDTSSGSERMTFGNTSKNPTYVFEGTGLATLGGALTVTGLITSNGGYSQTAGGYSYNVAGGAYSVTALSGSFTIADHLAAAWQVKEASNIYINVDTRNGAEVITLGVGDVVVSQDLRVDGLLTTKMGVSSGSTMTAGGTLYVNSDVSTLVENTAVETVFSLAPSALPANTLVVGRGLCIRAGGTITDTDGGSETLTLRLQLFLNGATAVTLATLSLTVADGESWVLFYDGHILSTGTDSTRVFRQLWSGGSGMNGVALVARADASPAINTTQTAVVRVTAQWASAHADNKVRMDIFEIELK